jgi:transcriptional regulator with XRE-family HTH domain
MNQATLRAEMDRRGMTQAELSRISHVSRDKINRYLCGKGDLYVRTYVRLWVALTGEEPQIRPSTRQ